MSSPLARQTRQAGFTFPEVVLSLVVFAMMALVFTAAVPVALKQVQRGSNYDEAALLCQHKMDQLRTITFSNLTNASALETAGVIDGVNADGTYDFSTNSADNLAAFFPPGTTGKISIAADSTTGSMSTGVYDVTVTIAWPASASTAGTYTLYNAIINY